MFAAAVVPGGSRDVGVPGELLDVGPRAAPSSSPSFQPDLLFLSLSEQRPQTRLCRPGEITPQRPSQSPQTGCTSASRSDLLLPARIAGRYRAAGSAWPPVRVRPLPPAGHDAIDEFLI